MPAASAGLDPTALHFLLHAPGLRSVADLVEDTTSRSLLQHALGVKLNPQQSAQAQAEMISAMLDFHEFQIPSRLQEFITLYNARTRPAGPADSAGPHDAVLRSPSPPISPTTLEHLARLQIGG